MIIELNCQEDFTKIEISEDGRCYAFTKSNLYEIKEEEINNEKNLKVIE